MFFERTMIFQTQTLSSNQLQSFVTEQQLQVDSLLYLQQLCSNNEGENLMVHS